MKIKKLYIGLLVTLIGLPEAEADALCISKTGKARVAGVCTSKETSVQISGPQGPTGAQGPAGNQGPVGPSTGYNIVDSKGRVVGEFLGSLYQVLVKAGSQYAYAGLTSSGLSRSTTQRYYYESPDCTGLYYYWIWSGAEVLDNFTNTNFAVSNDGSLFYIWDRTGAKNIIANSYQVWNSSTNSMDCMASSQKTVSVAPQSSFKIAIDMAYFSPPWSLSPK